MKTFKIIFIVFFILVAIAVLPPIINSRSQFNCEHEDIDILTARRRFQRYIFFIKVNEKIEETGISERWKKHFGRYPEPDWRRVNTFPGFGRRVSPHYVFHGALAAAETLEMGFQLASFSENAEKRTIHVFLQLLQTEKNDRSARRYCRFIGSKVVDSKEGQVITEDEIPSFDEWIEKQKEMNL